MPSDSPSPIVESEQETLSRAQEAFDRGDHRVAGELAATLASSSNEQVAAAARKLLFRLKTPGLSLLILLLTGFVLLAVTAAVYLKSQG